MYYRNCWHIFSPRLSGRNQANFDFANGLYNNCPNHPHRNASSSFRSLTKIPHCCRWRSYFKFRVAETPLSSAKDRGLWRTKLLLLRGPIAGRPWRALDESPRRPAATPICHGKPGGNERALLTLVPRHRKLPLRWRNVHVSCILRAFTPNHSQIHNPMHSQTPN